MLEGTSESLNQPRAYTPATVTPYKGVYPAMPEFETPWVGCLRVYGGKGKLSRDGKPLQSEDFGKCSALVIQHAKTLEAALFHVNDWDLTHEQRDILGKLSNGAFIGRFVFGDISRITSIQNGIVGSRYFTDPLSGTRRITILPDILANTGGAHWAIVYDSKTRLIHVQSKVLNRS